jgi:hypothetical protein
VIRYFHRDEKLIAAEAKRFAADLFARMMANPLLRLFLMEKKS